MVHYLLELLKIIKIKLPYYIYTYFWTDEKKLLMLLELIRGAKKFTMFLSQGVFGRVDFRKNGKKRRKNEEGKFFWGCLVGREGGKMCGGT